MATRIRVPAWFWIVAGLLALWGAMGVFACIQQFRLGAEAMGPATEYDRRLYASLPAWYNYAYLIGTVSGLLGALALLLKERRAVWLYGISAVFVFVMFGYLFITTDIIAVKGAGTVLPFPILILAIAAFGLWLARLGVSRGWLGR